MTSESENRGRRLLWGAQEIARFINRPPRAVHHLLESGALPATKVGNRWVSSEEALIEHIEGAIRRSSSLGAA